MMNRALLISCVFVVGIGCFELAAQQDSLHMWYEQPARNWNEALPIGNGKMGAMVFGGVGKERLQLNEETVWSGGKHDFVNPQARKALPLVRRLLFEGKYVEAKEMAQTRLMGDKKVPSSYQSLGDLELVFDHDEHKVTNYKRVLDLNNAIARVSYRYGRARYQREAFANAPDNVLVMRLSADMKGELSFTGKLSRPGNKASFKNSNDEILMHEHVSDGSGVKVVARLSIQTVGGEVDFSENGFTVRNADQVIIYLTAATDYWGEDPLSVVRSNSKKATSKSYDQLKQEHIVDYKKYFDRVKIQLGQSDAIYFPTDHRLKAVQRGSKDPHLIQLYYQFGRYLLISSSRPGGMPANLQGIWADGLNPPWDADYHININIQMNYWPAEITNLPEMHLPFLEFLKGVRQDGRKTSKDMYGIDGAVAHFTTDAWHFTEPYGQTQWAMWPMGLAWSANHLWEHFAFREDRTYLATNAYPILKDAALFCVNWLTQDPSTKFLVSGPSISPENTFKTKGGDTATLVMGPTMDHMIIRQLFLNTISAAEYLNVDAAFRKKLSQALKRVPPTRTGPDGRIMEWTENFEEPEPGHRHISHLYGLYPGNEITKQQNPELLEAARKTIAYRLSHGGGHTGWSRAWIINFFARLEDGDSAYENLLALLQKSTLPNLFDNHPPFQIDGNFGATAGITELLLQSHANEVHLLPALPTAWQNGKITGICARGGFEISMEWSSGTLQSVNVLSKEGKPLKIRYKDTVAELGTTAGLVYHFDQDLIVNK